MWAEGLRTGLPGEQMGRTRDLEWISVDPLVPLVPLGPAATGTVQGLDVPPDWSGWRPTGLARSSAR